MVATQAKHSYFHTQVRAQAGHLENKEYLPQTKARVYLLLNGVWLFSLIYFLGYLILFKTLKRSIKNSVIITYLDYYLVINRKKHHNLTE